MKYYYCIEKDKNVNHLDIEVDLWLCVGKENDVNPAFADWNKSMDDFVEELSTGNYKSVSLTGFRDEDVEQILPYMKQVQYLTLQKSPDLTDYSFVEMLSELEGIDIYWNRKATKLWNARRNTKLKDVHFMCTYKITDFSGLAGSSVENLWIYGCNFMSSFTSKVKIEDYSLFGQMPALRKLHLYLANNKTPKKDLLTFATFQHLEKLILPDYYTFEQFAWLRSKLPSTKGLEYCEVYDDEEEMQYRIIGKGKPKHLTSAKKAEEYRKQYEQFIEEFRDMEFPPE